MPQSAVGWCETCGRSLLALGRYRDGCTVVRLPDKTLVLIADLEDGEEERAVCQLLCSQGDRQGEELLRNWRSYEAVKG